MFLLTTRTQCKNAAETMIREQFPSMECAICLNEIDENNKGVVYITCGGIADLERPMCAQCDKRLLKQDPFKRQIEYRYEYPFVNDAHAKSFLEHSTKFVLNEGDPDKITTFGETLKSTANGYQDLELNVKLKI
ncbi:hypothetical protein [Phthorimaea operculella granulovirus]|uniref:Uncharacterized protein n=1 Tax=Phthorimaea operculella granulovirus TaxID=192584 RepID=Q8JRT7_9BBAC|nr:hypothetical protein [Phthorimaea operculella granulovirus]AAM70320.1 hypothetical protein [Phthorimaea operculella granulovirus]ANY57511.1 hypothetical protein PhopGVgp122 [Phthorimaea operculella granulovirus]QBH65957.1 hypothetical protein PhopGVgp122 [Phthorimaea operculella granulovirus]QBH66087.1 hypothetical protein PhopGVgp122 [Phthorimaea operculella granulovirus]QBH66217.1 hypothetical protein PhopGVgp122 [Phthorimaea operculella granulovirus]